MARFNVGQIVVLDASGFSEGGLRTGDRGTVVGASTVWGPGARVVFWHRLGLESPVLVNRLRLDTNPPDALGLSQGAFNAMMALQIVLREEQPAAVTGLLRELERDRVTWRNYAGVLEAQLEDLRVASNSHRSHAENLEPICIELQERMGRAVATLEDAVYEVNSLLDPSTRTVVPEVPRAALHRASNAKGTAIAELEGGGDDADEEDVTDDEI